MKKLLFICLLFLYACGPTAEEKMAMQAAAEAEQAAKREAELAKAKDSIYLTESVFIIDDVRKDQSSEYKQYHAVLSDNTSLGSSNFWFRAESKKYKLGDALILVMKPQRKADSVIIEPVNKSLK